MSRHESLDDRLRERAALYVLDALEPAEAAELGAHLEHCQLCAAEVRALAEAAHALGRVPVPLAPRPELWQRVLERVRGAGTAADGARGPTLRTEARPGMSPGAHADPLTTGDSVQVWKRWAASTIPPVVRADDGAFEPTAIPGIRVRRLALDVAGDRVTMLVRMDPGTSYPAHRHGGPEECLVLEGDISFAGCRMRRGDFQRVEQGSLHPVQSTEEGCLLLISSSLRDELV